MSLYVVLSNGTTNEHHIGKSIYYSGLIADVVEVQADGHELEWIKKSFTNLPYHEYRVNNWFGDQAKMIAKSLFYFNRKGE
jgi:hypothetical protein